MSDLEFELPISFLHFIKCESNATLVPNSITQVMIYNLGYDLELRVGNELVLEDDKKLY